MEDISKKSIGTDGKPIMTPGQELDISKRSKQYPTPPCALDGTSQPSKTFKILKKQLETT